MVRRLLLWLSLAGLGLFGSLFVLSFVEPLLIERAVREVVRIEIESRVGEKIDALTGSRIAALAGKVLQKNQAEMEAAEKRIRDEVPRKVAEVMSNMLKADCECRQRLRAFTEVAAHGRLSSLSQFRERLLEQVESAYANVSSQLLRELRIFSGSNALAFALLGLVTLLRGKASLQLILPAVVLLGAVVVTASLYLFNQDWLHTILFGEYVGLGYAAYLVGVAFLLADVVFNRARVSTLCLNVSANMVGSAVHALPC